MFFLFSKILDILFSPLAWGMALAALGLLAPRLPRFERWLRRAPALGLATLYFFSIEPVSNAIWRALEAPPLTTMRPDVTYDVAIILGGMLDDRAMATYGSAYYNDNVDRLIAARELLATGKATRALLSGGDGNLNQNGLDEARVLARQLESWGIAPDRLIIEDRSRNTRENAVESARILRERGWPRALLVTSAFHMPRALGCFRAVGLDVDTLAVDLRSDNTPKTLADLLPRTKSLHTSAAALRELAGRLIYRLRGYTALGSRISRKNGGNRRGSSSGPTHASLVSPSHSSSSPPAPGFTMR